MGSAHCTIDSYLAESPFLVRVPPNRFTKMKILEWMQNKLNGSNGKKKPKSILATYYMLHEPCKQEFSDWPQTLLAIGTFGNKNLKENSDRNNATAGDSSSSQVCVQELTLEEAGNLQNELNIYFRGQVESNWVTEQEDHPRDHINQSLNNEDSSLGLERKENETFSDDSDSNGGNFYPNSSLIHSWGIDLCLDNSKSAIGKKSLFFLLKKMFVCRSGFQPTLSFKDPLFTESRMEKILRAILHKNKKIYPKGSCSAIFIKKYLESRHMVESDNGEEELTTDADNGSNWDKTDSEYIVLEI